MQISTHMLNMHQEGLSIRSGHVLSIKCREQWTSLDYLHESQNHRIDVMLIGKDLSDQQPGLLMLPLNHVPQSHVCTSFKYLWAWWPHSFSGQPIPIPHHLSHEEVFLISNLNLSWHNLKPCTVVLLLVTWEKNPTSSRLGRKEQISPLAEPCAPTAWEWGHLGWHTRLLCSVPSLADTALCYLGDNLRGGGSKCSGKLEVQARKRGFCCWNMDVCWQFCCSIFETYARYWQVLHSAHGRLPFWSFRWRQGRTFCTT